MSDGVITDGRVGGWGNEHYRRLLGPKHAKRDISDDRRRRPSTRDYLPRSTKVDARWQPQIYDPETSIPERMTDVDSVLLNLGDQLMKRYTRRPGSQRRRRRSKRRSRRHSRRRRKSRR